MKFLDTRSLHERKIVQLALAYLAGAWLLSGPPDRRLLPWN